MSSETGCSSCRHLYRSSKLLRSRNKSKPLPEEVPEIGGLVREAKVDSDQGGAVPQLLWTDPEEISC